MVNGKAMSVYYSFKIYLIIFIVNINSAILLKTYREKIYVISKGCLLITLSECSREVMKFY